MLASRLYASEQGHWPPTKYDLPPRKLHSPRMSGQYDGSLPTHPDWQGQYSYFTSGDSNSYSHDLEQEHDVSLPPRQGSPGHSYRDSQLDVEVKLEEDSSLLQDQRRGSSNPRHFPTPSTVGDHRGRNGGGAKAKIETLAHNERQASEELCTLGPDSSQMNPESPVGPSLEYLGDQEAIDRSKANQRIDDDEDLEIDEVAEGEGEPAGRFPTVAERTAARRKMKRFRLTHQQTRFLVAEFTKQPHPDAAHRERLSKEIPGLSPRQVQVWFQNRRAKIKRLHVDDRDRMMRMRAVPEDFDNIQALRSPYGAVHGMAASLTSPVEFGTPDYTDHAMRPFMIDMRRAEANEHTSPTGPPQPFGSVGPAQSEGLNTGDAMPSASNDRYTFGSQLPPPLGSGTRDPASFADRPSSLEGTMNRQGSFSLQSLNVRNHGARNSIDSLQSPLQAQIPWKAEAAAFPDFGGPSSNQTFGQRQPSFYQPGQLAPGSSHSRRDFDADPYSGNEMQSPLGLGLSDLQRSLHHHQPPRSRAASISMPLSTDFRHQRRSLGSLYQPPVQESPSRPLTSRIAFPSPSVYTTSYPPAPLSAPTGYTQFRSSSIRTETQQQYSNPQAAAPYPSPNDFPQTFQPSISGRKTPTRGSFNES